MKVWNLSIYSFLNEIFLGEKYPNIIHQWIETRRFGILSFLNEIFLAEKYPIIIHQWIETWRFGISRFSRF